MIEITQDEQEEQPTLSTRMVTVRVSVPQYYLEELKYASDVLDRPLPQILRHAVAHWLTYFEQEGGEIPPIRWKPE